MSEPAVAAAGDSPAFQQKLGLFDATMLVAGSMIGSGIFIVSADIARDVGCSGWLLVVWLLTGAMTLIGALSYAELAGMLPHAGGQYVFLREAYGPLWGFLYGWTAFLVIQTGFIAAVAVAFAKYLGVLVPALGTDAILWGVEGLDLHLRVPVPWMDEPLTFFRRDAFTISAGQLVAVGLVAVLTAINCRGIEMGRWVQNVFTLAKTLGLVLLILVGLTVAASGEAIRANTADPWGGITQTARFVEVSKFAPITALAVAFVLCGAMVGALFSADAWNNVTFVAGEVKDPHRTLPWGLALGTSTVIVLYLLANLAYLAALPLHGSPVAAIEPGHPTAMTADELRTQRAELALRRGIDHARDDRVATAVLERVSPGLGVGLMALAIMISTLGCDNGLILMGPRLYYAMARDGLFFRVVGRLSRARVPAAGLVLQGLWSVVLIFSGSYNELLDYIIFAALLFYVLTVLAVFVLRRRRPELPRPYRAFGYPVVPALYIAAAAFIALALLVVKPVYSWPSFVIVLTGIPVFLLWRKRPGPAAAQ